MLMLLIAQQTDVIGGFYVIQCDSCQGKLNRSIV